MFGNVAFGLRMRGDTNDAIAARTTDLLELVGLSGFERRSVGTLSGGEQQRVALARALAPEPRVLLLDEPLGSLDRRLRDRLLEDLAALFDRLALTAVYVTHDQTEAFALGDRIAVMRSGRVVQVATPDELWARPLDADVARFLGIGNVAGGEVVRPEAVTVTRAIERGRGRRRERRAHGSDRPASRAPGRRAHAGGCRSLDRPPRERRSGRRRGRPERHRSADVIRRRVIVRGLVQGVFFRDSVRRRAATAGVSGWVRNTGDGAVEAVFEGEPDAVSQLVAFCREGPRGARVDAVEVTDEAPEGLRGFAIR